MTELDACWDRLCSVDPGNARDLAALRRVFAETTPAAFGWDGIPTPQPIRPNEPPRATAAHPRGYAGTIYKPPKKATQRVDVRRFTERWALASRVVGLDEPHPQALRSWPNGDVDPDALDPRVREALTVLGAAPAEHVLRVDRVVRRLADAVPDRFLFVRGGTPVALLAWMEASLVLPVEHRARFLFGLSTGLLPDANLTLVDAVARISALGDGFHRRAQTLIDRLRAGAAAGYIAGGLELESDYPARGQRSWRLGEPGPCDVASLVRRALDALGLDAGSLLLRSEPWQMDVPEALFDALGRRPSAAPFVESVLALSGLEPSELREWLELSIALSHEAPGVWEAAGPALDHALRIRAELLPALRPAFASRVLEGLQVLESECPDRALAILEPARRTAPHSDLTMGVVSDVLLSGCVVPLDDHVLSAIDAATRRRSNRILVSNGLEALLSAAGDFSQRMLSRHPRVVVRLALDVGALHPTRTARAIERALADGLWSAPSTVAELRAVLPSVQALRPELVPRALRAHLEGSRTLSPDRIRGRLDRVRGGWDLLRASLIRRHVDVERQRGVIETARELSDDERRAFDSLARAGAHRRGLKRVLRAVLEGRTDALRDHPETRRWLAQHPRIDALKLLRGVTLEVEVEGLGATRLAIERDLFAILRMGDHVGTCLALGDLLETDAAGIALDVNKRVVHARDANGRVLARQLLAVSEADELVCHPVYSAGRRSPALEDAFVRYDRSFAEHLGIALASDDEYAVASILSSGLWDDGRWERVIDR